MGLRIRGARQPQASSRGALRGGGIVSAMLNMRELSTLLYTSAVTNIQSYCICQYYVRVSQLFMPAAVKFVFRLRKVHLTDL